MLAKRTCASASLVVVLGASRIAVADPDGPARTDGEVRPDEPVPKTGTLSLGGGYVTDDRFYARARIAQPNLFGTGDLLELDALVSERRRLFDAKLVVPHVLDSDYTLAVDLFSDDRAMPGFERDAVGPSLTLGERLGDHLRGYLGYRLEQVTVTLDQPAVLARGGGGGTLPLGNGVESAVRAGLVYSTLDRPQLALHGSTIGAQVEIADPLLGSDYQLTRIDAWASTHQALGPFTVHVGVAFHTVGSRDPGGVPLADRLFLDGSSDIRGYAPGSIGPIDPVTGLPIGGTFELTGRAELEAPVIPRIGLSVVGFADAGGIFDNTGAGGIGRSVGFGVIWRSPLGPIRVDYAFPLTGGAPGFVLGIAGF